MFNHAIGVLWILSSWLPLQTNGLAILSGLSRLDFLSQVSSTFSSSVALTTTATTTSSSGLSKSTHSIRLPLKFLRMGGCWALQLTLSRQESTDNKNEDDDYNDDDLFYDYYAVIDTGSPFLTAPPLSMDITRAATQYSNTFEQYGEATGGVEWRVADQVTLLSSNGIILDQSHIVLGVPSLQVMEETGGIYVGLVARDDHRPTFLQQWGYRALVLDFASTSPSLLLTASGLVAKRDPQAFVMFSLQPYGPDLYHYAILCQELDIVWDFCSDHNSNEHTRQHWSESDFSRPVVAVLDTGLTGCILCDSLWEEIRSKTRHHLPLSVADQVSLPRIKGMTVALDTLGGERIRLSSFDEKTSLGELEQPSPYWRVSSFRLPWFYNEDRHPHVIALGNAFWTRTKSLTIDSVSQRIKIQL